MVTESVSHTDLSYIFLHYMLLQAIKFYVVPEIFIPYPQRVILENDEAKLEFLEGWVEGREGGFSNQKYLPLGGIDIFWNNTIHIRDHFCSQIMHRKWLGH